MYIGLYKTPNKYSIVIVMYRTAAFRPVSRNHIGRVLITLQTFICNFHITSDYKKHDPPTPPPPSALVLDQNEAQKAEKEVFFKTGFPLYLRFWMTALPPTPPPPPLV